MFLFAENVKKSNVQQCKEFYKEKLNAKTAIQEPSEQLKKVNNYEFKLGFRIPHIICNRSLFVLSCKQV
jgi:hypothetical protein